MSTALARIVDEDPSLIITRDSDTLETLLAGLGDTHVEVAVEKMKRKFGVDILLETPKVPYKETIAAPKKIEYRHKKQTGGHGQFGHVWLEIEPMSRGSGFEFEVKIVGGAVPREYFPAVEKGVQKAMADGVLAGFPVVDLKARACRRELPSGRLVGHLLRDRGRPRTLVRHERSRAGAARARHARLDQRTRVGHRGRHGRPQQQTRAYPGDDASRRR